MAFKDARSLLVQLQSFAGVTVPTRVALQTMGPISVLEETFGAVSRTNDQADVSAFVERLIESIDSILARSGTTDQIHSVAVFFDGLGAATLNRTTSMARRGPERSPRRHSGERASGVHGRADTRTGQQWNRPPQAHHRNADLPTRSLGTRPGNLTAIPRLCQVRHTPRPAAIEAQPRS